MTTLRKDSRVLHSNGTIGVIASMSKKCNTITIVDHTGSKVVVDYDLDEITKMTKPAYDEAIANASSANVNPPIDADDAEDKPKSKAEMSREIFVRMMVNTEVKRKDVIAAFKAEINLSQRGAETYYYNCTKARKAGTL